MAGLFQHQIIRSRLVETDIILKPRTAAAIHGHTQGLDLAGIFGNLGQTGKGTVTYSRGQGQGR